MYMCVWGTDFVSVATLFIFDFGNIPTVCCFVLFNYMYTFCTDIMPLDKV